MHPGLTHHIDSPPAAMNSSVCSPNPASLWMLCRTSMSSAGDPGSSRQQQVVTVVTMPVTLQ